MIYQEFQGKKLSTLGMGTMRLPLMDGNDANINVAAAEEMTAYAMEHGVNYFDTAWGYHAGNSETVMGKILGKYPRENYYLATKFPGYDLDNMTKVEEIFEKQLEKCGVDYFDFYLFHNVCDKNIDAYLDPQYGVYEYLMEQKKNGRIRHLGFSAHADCKIMERFLDAYGEGMEFCQIQLNYIDWSMQDAKAKVELLNSRKIPVWVMEPVRGGRLAQLREEDMNTLKALRQEESAPAWAFRFLQTIPGVTMILSGMSNYEQMKANIQTFETEQPLNEKEMETLLSIADNMQKNMLPCTTCRYCVTYCPQKLDIPKILRLYNEHKFLGNGQIEEAALRALRARPAHEQASSCVGCHSCEKVCPQEIQISKIMAEFTTEVNG